MSIERVLLEAGHRVGTVGLLLVAAGALLLWRGEWVYWYVLPAGFLVADVGVLCSFGAWVVLRREGTSAALRREEPPAALRCAAAWGAMGFNAAVMVAAGMLMLLARLHV